MKPVTGVKILRHNVSLAGQYRRQCTDIGMGLAFPPSACAEGPPHALEAGSEAYLRGKNGS
jgi:hypothetical protein